MFPHPSSFRRCFKLLGFEKFDDAYADGLQVLRYNETTAYVPHMDYLDDKTGKEAYDYDTSGKGGNRFATILVRLDRGLGCSL